jgi:hypothetical protein
MPKINISTKPMTAFSAAASRISFAAGAVFFVLFATLHYLEREFDPAWRFISEYQLGSYGWLMSIAFLALMVSSASLFVAVQSQIRTVGGYIGLLLLFISAVGFGLAGIFTSDSITDTTASTHGKVHAIAALLGGNVAGAAYFLGWSLARNKAWVFARRSLLWITGLAIVGNMASFWMQAIIAQSDAKFGPDVWIGWPNRVLIVAYAAWLVAMAYRVLLVYKSRCEAAAEKPKTLSGLA